jgi:hypothetical protein
MTTRAKTAKPAGTTRKSKKLALSKKTLKDLTPRSRAGIVLGGINSRTCGCI